MAVLLISGILGLLPLLAIAYIAMTSNGITVDALFMSLILLTISGVFFLNILLELMARRKAVVGARPGRPMAAGTGVVKAAPGTYIENGIVEAVAFYETEVGRPDKSLVTFRPVNSVPGKTLVFDGDLRNVLPAGKRVKITYTAGGEGNHLVGVGD